MNKDEIVNAAVPPSTTVLASDDSSSSQKDKQKIAGFFDLPKIPIQIPGVPGVNPLEIAKTAVIKEIGEAVGVGSPLLLDQKTAYPDVSDQVKDFRPQPLTITSAEDLQKPLSPGDYSLDVIAYCTQFSIHAPGRGLPYKLAPLMGKQAPTISALLSRGTLQGIAPATLNANAWRIQAGLPLKQWPSQDQALIHKLIPEYEKGLEGDYLQQIENTYNQFRIVPGIPSLNDLLRQSGAPGQTVLQLRQARQTLADQTISAERLPDMLYEPTGDGLPRVLPAVKDSSPSLWAEVQPGVFARFTVIEGNLGKNLFEFRVTPKAKSAAINNKSAMVATKELDKNVPVSQQTQPPATPASVVCDSTHNTYSKDRPAQALIPACVSGGKADNGKKHKGVTVYIWDAKLIPGLPEWGHASMELHDVSSPVNFVSSVNFHDPKNTYISWWPGGKWSIAFAAQGVNHTFEQDLDKTIGEGRKPDHEIFISCLDEAKIKTWWQKFKETIVYCLLTVLPIAEHCASVIEKAMYAGGGGNILPLWEKWQHPHAERELLPTRPQSLLELAEQLQNKCLELEGKQ
ncbi:MAG: hypothetical protein HWQ35_27850 [Nostoc sp. NMS1]|uniref:hypothetical protein n=1 Tax=Nostoc sp. NMS1 TaxID=2815388 RepID=UPI0025D7FFCE|nr:hypothetical protein [Nostoc sp. NMS1]MBN3910218.1 hypothetical protein [Nostoc sp. NMS1]